MIDTKVACPYCDRDQEDSTLCRRCEFQVRTMLDDLLEFWDAAHYHLTPSKGSGGKSAEMSIGVNVAALSFVAGHDILGLLHSWEALIRQERGLTPPAFLVRSGSLVDEISTAIGFMHSHLLYSSSQAWFKEFVAELKDLHSKGRAAAKVFVEKKKRIPCPGEVQGLPCGRMLTLGQIDQMMEIFSCPKCETEWTTLRLVAVAMSDPQADIWLDLEAIAGWLGISERQARRVAMRYGVARKGRLFNLKQMRDAYVQE